MASTATSKTTVGVFATRAAAEKAVADLRAAGYRDDQIGLVAKNAEGKTVRTDGTGDTNAAEGAVAGAVAAGGAMALGSLAVTFGVIPVIGPILAVGPLAAALISGAAGAAAGGIAGALIGWGIPEEDAKYYEGEVNAGRYVVTVESGDRDAWGVFSKHGGYNRTNARTTTAAAATTGDAGRTVQLKEEQLHAHKDTVKTGDVTVRKEVHTEQRQITVPVEREEVVIERHAVNKTGTGDIKAEEIRIPTKEERVHVSKDTVVTEEVSVGKRKVQDTKTVAGEVKKEELVVESEGKAKVTQTNKTDKK